MKRTRTFWRFGLLLVVVALIAAACGDGDDATDTTAAPEATTTTAASDDPTTTEAMDDTTTTAGESMDFGDPVTLTLGHPFPAVHPIQVNALEPYAAAVNEATNGTITIEFQPGGALAAPPATFENTVAGGQDMGWALQGYHAGVFPVTEIVEQPFQFSSAVQATQTLWDLYDEFPALQDEYADVQLLGLWTHDVGDIWTKSVQVQTTADMQGLNMRFPTGIMGQVMDAMGASSVGLPAPEIFDSLNTGVIDGLSIAVSGLESFGLYPELAYGTKCDCYVAAQYLVVNLDSWNALTPDAQQVMLDLGREHSLLAAEVYDEAYVAISQKAVEEGIEIYELPEDELANWHEIGQEVTDEWIAAREAEGVPAQEMYDRMQEIKAGHE
ncbi:MAG TPA: TRAP transporter substrate-binding protein [Acidimicrobiia bacterium]|nr:TRAP transporter substrate-binding protein [Acidimicrobiia bacterium]